MGKEGTRIFIPSHAFVSKTGKPVTGPVKIILEEFYSYDKMIAAGLGTSSRGHQLISGGMLYIKAESGGEELQIRPSVNITVKMPTKNYDGNMQLFTGKTSTDYLDTKTVQTSYNTTRDTAYTPHAGNNKIDWVATDQWQDKFERPFVKVRDMRNRPAFVNYGDKTVAVFHINKQSGLDKKAIKKELIEKYGYYYDKVKVRYGEFPIEVAFTKSSPHENNKVGDTISISLAEAMKYKMISSADSLDYIMQKFIADSTRYFNSLTKLKKEYTFRISNLGWINCDRFSKGAAPRVEFALNLGEGTNARNFQSQLVFTRYQSVMPAVCDGNRLSCILIFLKTNPFN